MVMRFFLPLRTVRMPRNGLAMLETIFVHPFDPFFATLIPHSKRAMICSLFFIDNRQTNPDACLYEVMKLGRVSFYERVFKKLKNQTFLSNQILRTGND